MAHKQNTYDLTGCHAIVTGGAGEIGQAIADRLSSSGAHVEVWDLSANQTSHLRSRIVDITDYQGVVKAMESYFQEVGSINILVNSAGITGHTADIKDCNIEDWQKTLDVNLNGSFYCTKAALKYMDPKRSGRIISLASIAGKEGNPGMAAYSAAKAGVIAMTKALGRELADTEIRVHAIAPALIQTNLLTQMAPEVVAKNLTKIPLGRAGTVDEVAELATWLASPGCSFSTGAIHDLSGGRATY
ncbi:SDR family NAD(P)-dependent oxidoreductase [Ahrensia sp. 13_GOM-1096m]|uniref:SDR family oxidoreductase n=1 Tax=Ahrensia sp. 13_GOM-1096m TaxID=1380380 RepID=UPI00047C78CE|nr:SDR family NAD(P)-dependent oxidoreductase [Ahrensia sp. 13_GOM-1096m]